MRPGPSTFSKHFSHYISLVVEDDIVSALALQMRSLQAAFGGLSESEGGHRYAPGKWTVREVLGHMIDCERVFGHRALWVARGDRTPLPGFEENDFAKAAMHDNCPHRELLEEFITLRSSHILMFRHLAGAAWERTGVVSGQPTTALTWAFVMVGHVRHHAIVLAERYGLEIAA